MAEPGTQTSGAPSPGAAPTIPEGGSNLAGSLYMAASSLTFACMDATMKALAPSFGAGVVTFGRFAAGLIALALAAALFRHWRAWRACSVRWQVLRGASIAVSVLMFVPALARLPLAEAMAVLQLAPVFMLVFARAFLGEPLGPGAIVSVLLGLAGALVVLTPGMSGVYGDHLAALTGGLLALGAAATYAAGLVATRGLRQGETPAAMIVWPCLAGMVLSAPAIALDSSLPAADDFLAALPLLLLIGALGTTASLFMVQAVRLAPVRMIAALDYMAILWGVLLGWLIWGEIPTAWFFPGGALIIVGGVIAQGGIRLGSLRVSGLRLSGLRAARRQRKAA